MLTLAAGLGLFAAALWLTGTAIFSLRKPGYSPIRHTISELGEVDAPDRDAVNYGVFLPVGVAIIGFALILSYAFPKVPDLGAGFFLFGAMGLGYVVAALAPCDADAPFGGSTRNQVHMLGGFIEYAGAAAGLLLIAEGIGGVGRLRLMMVPAYVLAAVSFAALLAMGAPFLSRWRGAIQRIAEIGLFLWIITVSLLILSD